MKVGQTVVSDSDPEKYDISDSHQDVTIAEVSVGEKSYMIESGEDNAELGVYGGPSALHAGRSTGGRSTRPPHAGVADVFLY